MSKNKTKPIQTNTPTSQELELREKLARSLADYANLEKRIVDQRQMLVTLATASFLNKLVPFLDDLYLAQSHLKDAGLQIAIDKLKNIIKSEGIEEINPPLGSDFDESTMTCITVVDGEPNKIVSLHKIGYKLNDTVLRPAEVIVGKQN